MPKYSSILNFGIRRSFKFGLISSLVKILNGSLGHNLMLAHDSWCQYPTCPEYINTKFSISFKYNANLSLLYHIFVYFKITKDKHD